MSNSAVESEARGAWLKVSIVTRDVPEWCSSYSYQGPAGWSEPGVALRQRTDRPKCGVGCARFSLSLIFRFVIVVCLCYSADVQSCIRKDALGRLNMSYKLILLSSIMVFGGVIEANCEPNKIEVLSAAYGDDQGHSCNAKDDVASVCNGRAECDFIVGQVCDPGPNAGPARNLEVHFACGVPLPDKAVAAAKGTRIKLDCQAQ
jgi:hypothetical protein